VRLAVSCNPLNLAIARNDLRLLQVEQLTFKEIVTAVLIILSRTTLDRIASKSLAKRKSKSLFLAEKLSKHRIAPMTKPNYTKREP
jgi:hypothetical protein